MRVAAVLGKLRWVSWRDFEPQHVFEERAESAAHSIIDVAKTCLIYNDIQRRIFWESSDTSPRGINGRRLGASA